MQFIIFPHIEKKWFFALKPCYANAEPRRYFRNDSSHERGEGMEGGWRPYSAHPDFRPPCPTFEGRSHQTSIRPFSQGEPGYSGKSGSSDGEGILCNGPSGQTIQKQGSLPCDRLLLRLLPPLLPSPLCRKHEGEMLRKGYIRGLHFSFRAQGNQGGPPYRWRFVHSQRQ